MTTPDERAHQILDTIGVRPAAPAVNTPHGQPNGEQEQDNPVARRLTALRNQLVDSAGLDSIPPPQPLVDGILYLDSLAWLHGKPGHGKSFVALDWAGCVATGAPWQGHEVTSRGTVVYLAAEGVAGVRQRVRAWEERTGIAMDGVRFSSSTTPTARRW